MRRRAILLGAAAAAACGAAGLSLASTIGNAERAILFTAAARLTAGGDAWILPVSGIVYEPETNSPARRAALSALRLALGLDVDAEGSPLFRRRGAAFLVDRESGEEVSIAVPGTAGSPFHLRTGRDGRFAAEVPVPGGPLLPLLRDRGSTPGWLEVAVPSVRPRARGWIQCIPPVGITVVSDIDDTVKDTRVLDRKEMLANTFLREYRAVPGMAEAYAGWAREGAVFHYLSAGPVPLQGFLEEFLAKEGFPPGELRMREFLWDPRTLSGLLSADPAAYKAAELDRLADLFPMRRFLLVGDSGERDPEAYGAFARRRPDAVARIFIREVHPGGSPPERWEKAFRDVDPGLWTVFTDPAVLGELPR